MVSSLAWRFPATAKSIYASCRTSWALDSRRRSISFLMIAKIGNTQSVEWTKMARRRNFCCTTMASRYRARWVFRHRICARCMGNVTQLNLWRLNMNHYRTSGARLPHHIFFFLFFVINRLQLCSLFYFSQFLHAVEQVNVTLKKPGTKLEHQGIKIELIGEIAKCSILAALWLIQLSLVVRPNWVILRSR